jgi:hypothetical protein
VRETAFSDFGLPVKTNFDVQRGGHVAWMVVTAIDADSSAARPRLGVGDRILAIDGRQITTFDRDAMLAALPRRSPSETTRLLVPGPNEACRASSACVFPHSGRRRAGWKPRRCFQTAPGALPREEK